MACDCKGGEQTCQGNVSRLCQILTISNSWWSVWEESCILPSCQKAGSWKIHVMTGYKLYISDLCSAKFVPCREQANKYEFVV